jgi:hypothetical protein
METLGEVEVDALDADEWPDLASRVSDAEGRRRARVNTDHDMAASAAEVDPALHESTAFEDAKRVAFGGYSIEPLWNAAVNCHPSDLREHGDRWVYVGDDADTALVPLKLIETFMASMHKPPAQHEHARDEQLQTERLRAEGSLRDLERDQARLRADVERLTAELSSARRGQATVEAWAERLTASVYRRVEKTEAERDAFAAELQDERLLLSELQQRCAAAEARAERREALDGLCEGCQRFMRDGDNTGVYTCDDDDAGDEPCAPPVDPDELRGGSDDGHAVDEPTTAGAPAPEGRLTELAECFGDYAIYPTFRPALERLIEYLDRELGEGWPLAVFCPDGADFDDASGHTTSGWAFAVLPFDTTSYLAPGMTRAGHDPGEVQWLGTTWVPGCECADPLDDGGDMLGSNDDHRPGCPSIWRPSDEDDDGGIGDVAGEGRAWEGVWDERSEPVSTLSAVLAELAADTDVGQSVIGAMADKHELTWCAECKAWREFHGQTYPSGDWGETCRTCRADVGEPDINAETIEALLTYLTGLGPGGTTSSAIVTIEDAVSAIAETAREALKVLLEDIARLPLDESPDAQPRATPAVTPKPTRPTLMERVCEQERLDALDAARAAGFDMETSTLADVIGELAARVNS